MAHDCCRRASYRPSNEAMPRHHDVGMMTTRNAGTGGAAFGRGGMPMPDAHTAERRKVVLVVEDEKAIGQLIADAISDEPGFTAIHVAGAAAALEATKHVIPDVLVLDVRLPGMNGFELYDHLLRQPRTAHIPVPIATANTAGAAAELRRRGITAFAR